VAGGDWVQSTNLLDHRYVRNSLLVELLAPLGARSAVQGGLRWDGYSTFGHMASPSLSANTWISPTVRLRSSIGHAFRIPTFTELYYQDGSNLGSSDLVAERGWALDAGADWMAQDWSGSATAFRRWDKDVIDWVRASDLERWRSTNVRDVTATGVELSLTRRWSSALIRGTYAALSLDAPALNLKSKYVLEYATHQAGLSVALPLGGGLRAAANADHRRRLDGQVYTLLGARVSRAWQRATFFVDGSNLLDEAYHEIAGVTMPGRWLSLGVTVE
jgi:iron complex outermembrane receptor protein